MKILFVALASVLVLRAEAFVGPNAVVKVSSVAVCRGSDRQDVTHVDALSSVSIRVLFDDPFLHWYPLCEIVQS
jgi:hypothetical protein